MTTPNQSMILAVVVALVAVLAALLLMGLRHFYHHSEDGPDKAGDPEVVDRLMEHFSQLD